MDFEHALLDALVALCGNGVGQVLCAVPVTRLADVVALFGVHLEATPGFFEHLDHVPLCDALFHASGEYLGGVLRPSARPAEVERLVGGDQLHARLFELVFDLGGDVAAPACTPDVFADDHVEAAVGSACFFEKVVDSAVAGHWDLHALVPAAFASVDQVLAAGFDVVEVRDDERILGEYELAGAQLPGD
ncbi:hypothetical protein LO763_14105 [Glycomyces sp. A-F 0318]|uniref:hypothetical protein n=1 Tax=Glycomyces amatae TaxID=2881355 RepID=UPI001E3F70EF|nr:hypothetical protein [Glycomyces amatae]MCD0444751.1 hypothetical protein [Glycomyces amatae]